MSLPADLPQLLAFIAEQKAQALGVPVAIAFCDAEGLLTYFRCMEGALPAARSLAINKAFTAASLRLSTEELGKRAKPGGDLYGIQHAGHGQTVLFGGGVPVVLKGQIVGGIGVSGGTVREDVLIADHALGALERMEQCALEYAKLETSSLIAERPLMRLLISVAQIMHASQYTLDEETVLLCTGALLLARQRDPRLCHRGLSR